MAYAELSDVEDRLEFDFENAEKQLVVSALEDLSVEARYYGRNWADNAAPPMVKRIILAAVVRYARNLEGYVQSRAGDEIVTFNEVKDGSAGSAKFTTAEIKQLVEIASGVSFGFGSISTYAWGSGNPSLLGYRPTDVLGEKLFPFFSDDETTV
jgi:hypothetical protein